MSETTATAGVELAEGETARYSAFAQFEDGSESDATGAVTVTSADTSVVSVDEAAGIVIGEGPGTTTVTADDGTYQDTVEVGVRETSSVQLADGQSASYAAFAELDNGGERDVTDQVTVMSSDESVVAVDETAGEVVGKQGGATATVTADDGTYQTSIDVAVRAVGGLDAAFATSSATATVGEQITFDASQSTGELTTFEWAFGDGTTATGKTVTHSYATTGEYDVTLTISDGTTTDTATTTLAVSEGLDFSRQPTAPVVGQSVTFSATAAEGYEWSFGDGTSATGQRVTHTFGDSGSFDVTLSTPTESVTRTMSVGPPKMQITEIGREVGGAPLESVSYEETFTVDIRGDATVSQVLIELGDESRLVTDGTDGWTATFDLGALSGSDVVTATAISERGGETTARRAVPVRTLPDWMELLLGQGEVTVDESVPRIDARYAPFDLDTYSFDLGGVPIDVAPPSFDGAPDASMGYDPLQRAAILDGDGAISSELFGYGFNAEFEVEGAIDSNLRLVRARGSVFVSVSAQVGPPLYVELPPGIPCLDDRLGIETTVTPALGLDAIFNNQLAFQQGTAKPGTDLTVGAELDICGVGAGASVTGGLTATFDVGTDNPNLTGTVSGAGEFWINIYPFTASVSVDFEIQLPTKTNAVVATATPSDVEWELAPAKGPQSAVSMSSVDETGTTTASTELAPTTTGATTAQRLTDREREDTQPAIAALGTETVVVWARQDPNKDASNGGDIAYRSKRDGSWNSVAYITDTPQATSSPAVAATDTKLLAAWEYVDADIDDETDPADVYADVEIAYAIYDGESWSSPTVFTDNGERALQPTVARDGNRWLLAWEQDSNPDPGVGSRSVRYVSIGADGTTGTIQTVADAAYPAAGPHPEEGAMLGYATLENGQSTAVESVRLASGITRASQQFTASEVRTITVGDGRVVWQSGPVDEPTLIEGNHDTGVVTELTIRDEVVALAEPSLATDGVQGVLGYRAYVDGGDTRELVYRLDRGNGWIFDRQFVQAPASGQTVWQPAPLLNTGAETFLTAFTVGEQSQSGTNDIFVAERDFRPEYAVAAFGPSDARAGDTVTIEYTLRNRGDVDGTQNLSLTVSNAVGTQASKTLAPLAAGDTTNGSMDVVVDKTGTFTVSVDTSETTTTTAAPATSSGLDASQTTVTVATPALRVAGVETVGPERVAITVRNDGGAAATSVPLAVTDGEDTLATATLDSIGVGETAQTTAQIDPGAIDRSSEDEVVLDPDKTMPAAVSEAARTTPTWLLQPALSITEEIRYESTLLQGLAARVLLTNESPVSGSGTLRALVDDQTVGTTAIALDGADGGAVYETVTVPLGGVSAGEEVTFELEPIVPEPESSSTATSQTVGPVFDRSETIAQQWAHDLGDGDVSLQFSRPAVDGNRVYVGGLDPEFRALSRAAAQQRVAWRESRSGALSDSSPAVANGRVYVGGGGGVLYAFDPDSTDRLAWTYQTDSAITSSPVVADGRVFFGANDGMIHAVDRGTKAWSPVDVGGPIYSPLATADGQVFVTTVDGRLVTLDAATGDELWAVSFDSEFGASGPAVEAGAVYVANDAVRAVDAATGEAIWPEPVSYGGPTASTPTVQDGTVYVGGQDGTLSALDTADGTERWSLETDGAITGSPTVAGNRVAVSSLAGTVTLLNTSGTVIETIELDEELRAGPLVSDRQLIVGAERGRVLSFQTSE